MKKFKIGDTIKVISGKDKGQTGQIKSLFHQKGKVIIEGINTKIKHVKPSKKDEVGKIIQFDAPLDISNIMLCDENGVAGKIGFQVENGKKVRIFKKTKKLIS
jgi:large subunit ribosomal protein L24|uniref:Large ribosomal subunit protein uL24c n=1 Tax=Pseudopedinella elastica TaxID=35684 RepID=A0A516ZAI7_9STRA|nr:ribosomal protein L24 [Pseudopedinella elastica]QDR24721.1 ribosomal protein L24 [Pseudopedinella elastica]|tara:strand:+ start:327 stop:635 length:309 start_codon:yes stop_codon:yes gene_type:complete